MAKTVQSHLERGWGSCKKVPNLNKVCVNLKKSTCTETICQSFPLFLTIGFKVQTSPYHIEGEYFIQ